MPNAHTTQSRTQAKDASADHAVLLKETQVVAMLAISHATWWRWVKANPETLKPIRLGPNTTRWRSAAVQTFIEQAEQRDAKARCLKGGADA